MYFPSIFYSMAGLLEDKLTGVMSRSAAAGESAAAPHPLSHCVTLR